MADLHFDLDMPPRRYIDEGEVETLFYSPASQASIWL